MIIDTVVKSLLHITSIYVAMYIFSVVFWFNMYIVYYIATYVLHSLYCTSTSVFVVLSRAGQLLYVVILSVTIIDVEENFSVL